jgi:hypothetical protein
MRTKKKSPPTFFLICRVHWLSQAYLPLFFVLGACWVPQMSEDLGSLG